MTCLAGANAGMNRVAGVVTAIGFLLCAAPHAVAERLLFIIKCFIVRTASSGSAMNSPSLLRQPSGFVPVAMSGAALALVLLYAGIHGTEPQPDEGAAAHIWQLLMAGQLPIMAYFAIKWLPQSPRPAALVLGLQVGAALAAAAPVFLMGW